MRIQILTSFLFLLTFSLLISCKTTQETSTKTEISLKTADSYTLAISKNSIYQKPLVADLEVGKEKLTMTRIFENMTIVEAKENVTGEFSIENNCDVVVQPLYETSTIITDNKNTITVSLSGYPAFYRNIRNFDPKDTAAFMINAYLNLVTIPTVQPKTEKQKGLSIISSKKIITSKKEKAKKEKVREKPHFGIAANGALPLDILAKSYNIGYGGSLLLLVPINKLIAANINVGYLQFPSKYTALYNSLQMVSGNLGVRFRTKIKIYVEPAIGYNYNINNSHDAPINLSGGVGYATRRFDVSVRYENTISGLQTNYFGARVGFYF